MICTTERMAPLEALRLGIDTHHEPIIYLHADSPVCRSEGFAALSRVLVSSDGQHIIATLNIITGDLVANGQIGFSEPAWKRLGLSEGAPIRVSHPAPVQSLSYVRAKVFGHTLDQQQLQDIIDDIVDGRYADVHVAAFITACGADNLSLQEISALTRAMVNAGDTIDWHLPMVIDKHCVGGLPGNRTTPILVSILTASGLTVPKTSSRAITSPAGTADTMEVLTNVCLSQTQMKDVVNKVGGCLAWGGSVRLSPADDLLIQVERALDIDSEGQLIASVLSKKIAAGATHVLIDIPVGPSAKVRSQEAAAKLADTFRRVAAELGLNVSILCTDGSQPIGCGIGPALEARDILAVLQGKPDAPQDLKDRACLLAGAMLEMAAVTAPGQGQAMARNKIDTGEAWRQFKAICMAQGGLKQPPVAPYRYTLTARHAGIVQAIDNRLLSKIAKLAGAPADPAAGVEIPIKLGDQVEPNAILLSIHAESSGELNYAVDYLENHLEVVELAAIEEQHP
ncbi:thymidine phosphorylase family protein [Marinobacterium sedimentorum]|uniref:thymidine phosphorylase family protein n=1 Tax=Marinobacterium sedimentorum TaxID=2927804 RepID=UPI0020C614D2|nr:thymidine phosphorylase family protein [Marinobacterium sedimentorum]MCP8687962.1 thymidine phosphorylase family protein [Marinobacterium sedimentorum]